MDQSLLYEVILNKCSYRVAVRVGSDAWKSRESDGPRFSTLAEARQKAKSWNSDYREHRIKN